MYKDSRHWSSKSVFLHNVLGSEIVKKQNELNVDSSKDVVASQVFLLVYDKSTKVARYDAFIYFKHKFGDVKGL